MSGGRLPSREQLLRFIRESPVPVTRREVARAFGIKGDDRVELKQLMRELQAEGLVERGHGRRVALPERLPGVTVIAVTEIDLDGDVLARPATWSPEQGEAPRILLKPERRGHPAARPGDRLLARLIRQSDGTYLASTLKRLDEDVGRMVGVFRGGVDGGRVRPADKRARHELIVPPGHAGGAEDGELVVAELLASARLGHRQVRVVERLGDAASPRTISLIAIHSHGLQTVFPEAALEEAADAPVPELGRRVDLRDVPLVTIDGEDARDFDDAVWAEADPDPANAGGWHALVAIADVAHYVRPGGPLDRAARERGNSAYFPDRVVPMLPEALSNDLCSLRPGEPRACMAAELWIAADGTLLRHRFLRGLMRSAARLTYTRVQDALEGRPDDGTGPLLAPVLRPLEGCFRSLLAARERRETLELDLPERQVRIGEDGRVADIRVRPRFDSHKLIEELMIAANVAAADTLERMRHPCLYRVHDSPSPDRLDAVREFLATLGHRLAKGQVIRAGHLNAVLKKTAGTPHGPLISTVILRAMAQAQYSPDNIGHFGLALLRYAHFTSPIRRYADLVVHRALIRALDLGEGGLSDAEMTALDGIGAHVSATERRAAEAERDAIDRFMAAFLSDRIGATFSGRITGVTRFGLFVTLEETGADGLVPIASLTPDDYYEHDEANHSLVGRRWGRRFVLMSACVVRLTEADALTGSTLFRLIDGGNDGEERIDRSSDGSGRPVEAQRRVRANRSRPR